MGTSGGTPPHSAGVPPLIVSGYLRRYHFFALIVPGTSGGTRRFLLDSDDVFGDLKQATQKPPIRDRSVPCFIYQQCEY